ncbi:MAG: peptide chain release factor N(5)-glutamine methyltransferase [Clostridia bacterium]|nr:peptide chain release factor N(5)-glutamine methyltransferase [Clostridia bacterium]
MYFFPLKNGNIYCSKNVSTIAKLNSKGLTEIKSERERFCFDAISLPFFRGIAYFIFGIYLFIKNILVNYYDNFNKKTAFLTVFYIFSAMIVSFSLFVIIPYFCMLSLVEHFVNYYVACFIIAFIRIALLTGLLFTLKFIPTFKQIYRHNAGVNLAVLNSEQNSFTLSTNFLSYFITVLFVSFFILTFTSFNIAPAINLFANLLIIYIIIGAIYEIEKLLENKDNIFSLILVKPFSYFVTEKPGATEKNIAIAAIKETKLMMENKERENLKQNTDEIALASVIAEVKDKLEKAGIVEESETDWLICECLNCNRTEMKLKNFISKEQYKKILLVAEKRAKRIPLNKIFNRANFYGYNFYIDKNVLAPRPETELLVQEVLEEIKEKNQEKLKILDLCTGSGCIAIVLAKKSNAKIYASDVSLAALKIAKKNAENFDVKVKFINSDIFKNFKRNKFDIIVSNPPYIKTKDILALDDEVKKYDPLIALDGGENGLYFYDEIIKHSPNFLKKNGKIFFEIGYNQAESIKKLLQNQFENITIKKDYSGNDRIVVANLKGKIKNAR